VPRLSNDDFNVIGDATLGYNAPLWGIVGRAGLSVFNMDSASYVGTTLRSGGNADGWLALKLSDSTRLELRGTFDVTVFDSDASISDEAEQELIAYTEELSFLLRAGGLLGVRTQGPLWAVGAWAGGGVQLESYSGLSHDPNTEQTRTEDNESVGAQFEARMRAQWSIFEDLITLRASFDSKYYKLTRLSSSTEDFGVTELDTEAVQLEALGRAFVDVEALRTFEFVPGVGIGVDHYQLAIDAQETQSVTIPVFLLGIRRAVF
jgi:hypothetical protein